MYDRTEAPCPELATRTVQDDGGNRYVVYDGHAEIARIQIFDSQVLPGQHN
ncbi:hypothetical protein [Streptomyces spongiae]|uniref:hypothetical protein n=1 Tax=Streptomyces spongiae TaxID=565072 RepID=UPI001883FA13|nr:hypothetical protein [Streptomyces spongiae]